VAENREVDESRVGTEPGLVLVRTADATVLNCRTLLESDVKGINRLRRASRRAWIDVLLR